MTATHDRPGSPQQPLPRQLRLPGQADAPAGPLDLSTMYLMHHGFRRDLAAFARAVPRTPVADRGAWRALLRRWELFAELLHHHHRAEDTWIWPALLERADADEQGVLRAMEAEHEQIDPVLAGCADGVRRLAEGRGGEDDRAALAVRLCAARESLDRHLAHEERDALRILQRHVGSEEWHRIEQAIEGGRPDPRLLLAAVPWLLHEVPAVERREQWREAPRVLRGIWRLTHRRFERLDRRAFRHAG